MRNKKTPRVLVSVVDDDKSVRESLPDLLHEFGLAAKAFPSAEAFLKAKALARTKCLVLDVSMPGMSGPDLKLELERRGHRIPVIFITAHAEEVERLGLADHAVACLIKPFDDKELHKALKRALGM